MSGPTDDQNERAEILAEWLEVAGHEDLSALDLLDALASTGMLLEWDKDGVTAAAYWENIQPEESTP